MSSMHGTPGSSIWDLLGASPSTNSTIVQLQSKLLERKRNIVEPSFASRGENLAGGDQSSCRSTLATSSFQVKVKPIVEFSKVKCFVRDKYQINTGITKKGKENQNEVKRRELPRRSVQFMQRGQVDNEFAPRRTVKEKLAGKLFPALSHHQSLDSPNFFSKHNRTSDKTKSNQRNQFDHSSEGKLKGLLKDMQFDSGRNSQKISYLQSNYPEESMCEELPSVIVEFEYLDVRMNVSQRPSVLGDKTIVEQPTASHQQQQKIDSTTANKKDRGSQRSVRFSNNTLIELMEEHETRPSKKAPSKKKSRFFKNEEQQQGHFGQRSSTSIRNMPGDNGEENYTVDDANKNEQEGQASRKSIRKAFQDMVKEVMKESAARSIRKRNVEPIGAGDSSLPSLMRKSRANLGNLDFKMDLSDERNNIGSGPTSEQLGNIVDLLLIQGEGASVRHQKLSRIQQYLSRSRETKRGLKEELKRLIEKKMRQHQKDFQGDPSQRKLDEQFMKEVLALVLQGKATFGDSYLDEMRPQFSCDSIPDDLSFQHKQSSKNSSGKQLSEHVSATHEIKATFEKCHISRRQRYASPAPHYDNLEQLDFSNRAENCSIQNEADSAELAVSLVKEWFIQEESSTSHERLQKLLRKVKRTYPVFWKRLMSVQPV